MPRHDLSISIVCETAWVVCAVPGRRNPLKTRLTSVVIDVFLKKIGIKDVTSRFMTGEWRWDHVQIWFWMSNGLGLKTVTPFRF
ncbi:MAG: hypothetical protein KAI61_08420 [Alphaproteobacteria bacterium]|nr:hypothetical protein [Alphaproteobacteria bacterium]MCK5519425.1 hypothetical protein [Alphaproteobacteria bacterium]MCK5659270.1 hypothetical protein [Alphaproteobacteria bacterium]